VRVRSARQTAQMASRETQHYTPPLTIGRANAELCKASSAKKALDQMAFPPPTQLGTGELSALSVLGKEKIKL
jgi:hypothetical protein